MYSVLVVDDEVSVTSAISESIPWSELGFSKVHTASSALKALEIIRSEKIHLLITDICMPQMNGLELLNCVRADFPPIRCIILTAYGEFDYARKALSLGVENYLLKPIMMDELEKTIKKAIENIEQRQDVHHYLFRNNILLRWISSEISSEELTEKASLLKINLFLKHYCVVLLRSVQSAVPIPYEQLEADKTYASYGFWDSKGNYVFLIGGAELTECGVTEYLRERFRALACENTARAAVGKVVTGSDSLSSSYQSALRLTELFTRSHSAFLTAGSDGDDTDAFFLQQIHNVMDGPEEKFENRIRFFIASVYRESPKSAEETDSLLDRLVLFLCNYLKNQHSAEVSYADINNGRSRLYAKPSEEQWAACVRNLFATARTLVLRQTDGMSPIVRLAIGYLNSNLEKPFSIKEFCCKNAMNASYFGYTFKKETGFFINDYLTRLRIGRAIRMLRDTTLTITEISDRTGFSSISYFTRCFKDQTGYSPKKYRQVYGVDQMAFQRSSCSS